MSHFLVGVIVDNTEDLEDKVSEILAPYDENIEVEPYISRTREQMIAEGKDFKKRIMDNSDKYDSNEEWVRKYLDATTDEDFYQTQRYDYGHYDEDGNELATYNPKSKWDWWCIGGRWSDGEDVIQIRDFILYNKVGKDKIKLYKEAWNNFENGIEQPQNIIDKIFGGFLFWNDKYYLERYKTCENWIRQDNSNIPYAFVDENGWHQQGDMGWWGCDNATSESIEEYVKFAEDYFRDVKNQDKYIVWVDCHI